MAETVYLLDGAMEVVLTERMFLLIVLFVKSSVTMQPGLFPTT